MRHRLIEFGFLSTLSLRRATGGWRSSGIGSIFLSTLSLRRATELLIMDKPTIEISIHALLAESDQPLGRDSVAVHISIHALLAESDFFPPGGRCPQHHFYPRSPCGERRGLQPKAPTGPKISIHALLAESDFADQL